MMTSWLRSDELLTRNGQLSLAHVMNEVSTQLDPAAPANPASGKSSNNATPCSPSQGALAAEWFKSLPEQGEEERGQEHDMPSSGHEWPCKGWAPLVPEAIREAWNDLGNSGSREVRSGTALQKRFAFNNVPCLPGRLLVRMQAQDRANR